MANPAEALHKILSDWLHSENKAIYLQREKGKGTNSEVMKRHRMAMLHLCEIEELVRGMDKSESRAASYARSIDDWTKWILAYPHDWHAAPKESYPGLSDLRSLDMLDLLAQHLEILVPTVTDSDRATYSEIINQIAESLGQDDSLPTELRQHVHLLISQARHCLEEYQIVGDFALRSAIDRLTAAVTAAANQSKKPDLWQTFKDRYLWSTAVGLTTGAPGTALAIASAAGSA